MENERSVPQMLPMIEYNGQSWFIDDRLGQFRDVWNPGNYVDFDSEEGRRMLAVRHAEALFGGRD